jgi:spore maturation protein CgeB
MRFVMFYHSLVSDWNHGNAHFLRGVATELQALGHEVTVYEPADGWSRRQLLETQGPGPIEAFGACYPTLRGQIYDRDTLDLDRALAGADVVIAHEWNDPQLIAALGAHRSRGGGVQQHQGPAYQLFFHDTHHRAVTDPEALGRLDLRHYDGVLAFGGVLAEIYRGRGWSDRVFVWHEAADTRVFHPRAPAAEQRLDLVWVGNWGDDERAAELEEFLLGPVRALGLSAEVWGVRYPASALEALERAGIRYRGWLPNFEVPAVFARARLTVHVPRRPYAQALAGIPTIRPFEAMACGIPLISAPWRDSEGLFREGGDYLVARDGEQMATHMRALLTHPALAHKLSATALATISARHTCGHRARELLEIVDRVRQRRFDRRGQEATVA